MLEESGELDNTIVVMTGDHGMPFPRCKSNNYDSGARVPLAIRWPSKVKAGTVVNDFVSLVDVAPTFYQAADLDVPSDVSGRSLLSLLAGKDKSDRSYVLHGKERHVPGQEGKDMGGYPTRAIRTHDFLYLHNFRPDRWPAGTPDYQMAAIKGAWLSDCDNGPTKTYMVENRDKDAHHRGLYELAFGKRPATELYDLKKDPDQLVNIAADSAYAETVKKLKAHLFAELEKTNDPRVTGKGPDFDKLPLPWRSSEIPRSLTRDFKIMNSKAQGVWMKRTQDSCHLVRPCIPRPWLSAQRRCCAAEHPHHFHRRPGLCGYGLLRQQEEQDTAHGSVGQGGNPVHQFLCAVGVRAFALCAVDRTLSISQQGLGNAGE